MRILVTGATGYIGSQLVPELLARGHSVRCLAREPQKLAWHQWQGIEVVAGDVLAPPTLEPAFSRIEAAYYLVHSMSGGDKNFAEKDRTAARNFARTAESAGVKRIIYLGGLGDGATLSEHLTSRQETGDVLRQGTVPVTELRAAIIVGSGSASFEIIRDLARKLPVMICPRWVSSRCEPIAVRDVLAYLTRVLEEPRTTGGTFEIGGGEVFTYADLMRTCAQVMGSRIRIFTVPFLTPRLSAYWLNLVAAVPMSIAYPLVEGLRNDVVCRDRSIRELIPLELLPFREAVARNRSWAGGGCFVPLDRGVNRESGPAMAFARTHSLWQEIRRLTAATCRRPREAPPHRRGDRMVFRQSALGAARSARPACWWSRNALRTA